METRPQNDRQDQPDVTPVGDQVPETLAEQVNRELREPRRDVGDEAIEPIEPSTEADPADVQEQGERP